MVPILVNMTKLGRREFFQSALLGAVGTGMAGFALEPAVASPQATLPLSPALLSRAKIALQRHGSRIWNRETMAVVDFSVPSRIPRFFLVNLQNGQTNSLLVAHGKGSDPMHSGWVQNFSNIPGSEATSSGSYMVGEGYIGQHGSSRRLIGLDPENDQAEARAIVIHPAWYVSETMIQQHGKIGRSQGCFAFSEGDINQVLSRLGAGTLLYAEKA